MGPEGALNPCATVPPFPGPIFHISTYVSKILQNMGGPCGPGAKFKNSKIKKCLQAVDCLPGLHVFALGVLCPLGPMFTMDEQVAQGGIDGHGVG